MSDVTESVEVKDSETSESIRTCTSSGCRFDAGVAVDINIHAGDLFSGNWQHEISWEIYDSDDHDVIAGGAPKSCACVFGR